MITVYDFINLFIEPDMQTFSIFDIDKGKEVYRGFASDVIPDEFGNREVASLDNTLVDYICINI